MANPRWTLFNLILRGSLLFLGLMWFLHYCLTHKPASNAQTRSFLSRLADKAEISEQQVRKVLLELGPALAEEVYKGNQVHLPGLGYFRAVDVPVVLPGVGHLGQGQLPALKAIQYTPDHPMVEQVNHLQPPSTAASEPLAKIPPSAPGS